MRSIASLMTTLALVVPGIGAPRTQEATHAFFTTSDGVKIHYMTLGRKGSYVVLIHGYTGSAEGNWFRNGVAARFRRPHPGPAPRGARGGPGFRKVNRKGIKNVPADKRGTDPQEAEASRALRIRHAMDTGPSREEGEKLASTPPPPRPAPAA